MTTKICGRIFEEEFFCRGDDKWTIKIFCLWRRRKTEKDKEEKARPSILCVTHQISRKKRNYPDGSTVLYKMMNCIVISVGAWWSLVNIGRYWLTHDSIGSV